MAVPNTVTANANPVPPAPGAAGQAAKAEGVSGQHRAGNSDDQGEWVPSEFKQGMMKFRDTYVYADGTPVGIMDFAELPLPLEPVWIQEEGMLPYNAKRGGPTTRTVYQRRYRFVDYLKALRLPIGRIKEVHIYGGSKRQKAAAVIPGRDLRRHAKDFMFRFGAFISGKPIPICPEARWNCPDNITTVTVYIDKKPPERTDHEMVLNGKPIHEIPYFGEPLRGGIRISLDNRYVARIKRRLLDGEELREVKDDGSVHWNFLGFLRSQGVRTDKIKEAWLIYRGKPVRRLDAGELSIATFTASPQGKGEVLLGWDDTPTTAVLLYTKPRNPRDLPNILPHERGE